MDDKNANLTLITINYYVSFFIKTFILAKTLGTNKSEQ